MSEFERINGPLGLETKDSIDQLIANQLLAQINDRVCLTHRGVLCYDSIAAELI